MFSTFARYAPVIMVASTLAAVAVDRAARDVELRKVESPREDVTVERSISSAGHDVTPLSDHQVQRLASRLEPEAYRVTQRAGTEPPFCGKLLHNDQEGTYTCAVCGLPLFTSDDKFESGTGWPSFTGPVASEHIVERRDSSHGMVRTEISCARCDAHLGHVFPDGPRPTGMRYCLNSAAMGFVRDGEPSPDLLAGLDSEG